MSDFSQALVLRVKEPAGAAASCLAWLVARGIVEALPTDCVLGPELGHPPGPKLMEALVPQTTPPHFLSLKTNGLALHVARPQLWCEGDELPELSCRRCGGEVDFELVVPLLDRLGDPFHPPDVECTHCHVASRVFDLGIENGAIGNLTLEAWNWWPLRDEVLDELGTVAGAKVVRVWQRL